jgi:hypothetical protein
MDWSRYSLRHTAVCAVILLVFLPFTAASQVSPVSHEDGHAPDGEEAPGQGIWEQVKQFLKDLLPAPVTIFFEEMAERRNNESSGNPG